MASQGAKKSGFSSQDSTSAPSPYLYAFMGIVTTWLVILTYNASNANNLATLTRRSTQFQSAHESFGSMSSFAERENSPRRVFFGPNVTYLEGLATCESFKCVREAYDLPRELPMLNHGESSGAASGSRTQRPKFNWPHFFIAGYSKSATTSLYVYLNKHPQVSPPRTKEPALWTNQCQFEGNKNVCNHSFQRDYLVNIMKRDAYVESGGSLAQFEATPRIFDLGPELAEILGNTMPWIKLVVSMREPISRAISKYHMFSTKFGKGCLVNSTLSDCFRYDKERFYGNPRENYYHKALKYWLDSFPTSQIKLIQYEDLVGERQAEELRSVKEFLDLDPDLTGDSLAWGLESSNRSTGNINCRHCDQPGWALEETLYRRLVDRVRKDAVELVRTIDKFGLGNGTRWMESWQRIWDANLATCKGGMCEIKLS